MVNEGLVKEVKSLYDQNIRSKAIMTGIGYKELYKYFDNEISLSLSLCKLFKILKQFFSLLEQFINNIFSS